MEEPIALKDMSMDDMSKLVQQLGQPAYRAQQIFSWIYKGIDDIDEMSNMPADFRKRLKERCYTDSCRIYKRQQSEDGSAMKYLFLLKDGNIIESVLMRYEYGNSVCVSTQIGCRMGCAFCASTIKGVKRNLTKGEMIDQVLRIQQDIGQRVSHVVLMGSGEPLDNYEQSIAFMRLLHEPKGLNMSYRNITLSTCGLVPHIYDLAKEGMPITLAVSLHAPNDDIRKQLIPISKAYSIDDIIKACNYYIEKTGRRITFEYIMLKDINDREEHAYMLADALKGMICHVNLIPFNDVEGREFQPSSQKQIEHFYGILNKKGIPVSIRRRLGTDIDAACGQLRRRFVDE
ncbi:23S rRNA (adenine(2503)-C(2))-methyltransferase RlmN [Mahella sp.]|uniref:23S rRNA (adenine(2503)-C(2))-methyltransferase RlmN n=1 Tax=Mahella sp. TaxID=2798721 RepID=UPI0025BC3ECA|nr:23S rRNA (adenine(2503)-C(2))-methyltransferase RlmN [Mahella sp.]MBZ4665811.1 rRNA m(2)A-2503 methyltransferase [Mahella sp.]